MTDQNITKAKFHACMRNSILRLGVFELYSDKKLIEFDFQEFQKILIKHDLDEFSELLYSYFYNLLEENEINSEHFFRFKSDNETTDKFRLELLEILRFIMKYQDDYSITFKSNIHDENISTNNDQLLWSVEKCLWDLFQEYITEFYSAEEADLELQKERNFEWINNWAKEKAFIRENHDGNFYKELDLHKMYMDTEINQAYSGLDIKEMIIKKYRQTHLKHWDNTADDVDDLILKYKDRFSKNPGATLKNLQITMLIYELEDLLRINRFLADDDLVDIDKIKLSSSDYRFIYKCLDFWGFLPANITSPTTNYIRITKKQTSNHLPPDYDFKRKERLSALKSLR